jgi:hypothetical protein
MDTGYGDDDADDAGAIDQSLAKEIDQMRRLSKGGPWLYLWNSPIGEFQVCVGASTSGSTVWRLGVRQSLKGPLISLGTYPDYTDAMLAVCNRKTGWLKWDQHPELIELPMNSSDWDEIG